MQYTLLLLTALLGSTLAQPTKKHPKAPHKPNIVKTHKAVTPVPPPGQEYNPCDPKEVKATKCKGPKDCLYPNPANCGSFIACVPLDGLGNAKPVVKQCPPGLQWNDTKKWCDWPDLSTCPTTKPPQSE